MSGTAVARSSLITTLKRYARSPGLWLLLLIGPIGARFMIARDDGSGVQIAIGHHLPTMTSAMLGISLGIVVSTLLLPVGFLYLRSNITRRQPWQIEEVTGADRVGIVLGRFGADVAVLFAMLGTLNVAGWLLGWWIVSGALDIGQISLGLWLVAAPALMGLAALHVLLDAMPFARRAFGDLLFFIAWFTSIALPAAVAGRPSSFVANMYDFAGFVRPLVGAAPSANQDFSIGSTTGVLPGRIPLDVWAGIHASGYMASRLAWAVIAVTLATIAGLLYRPHTVRSRGWVGRVLDRWLATRAPPPVIKGAPPAQPVARAFLSLIWAEFRLVGGGRLFHILAIAAALLGLLGDYRHVGGPAALLLLVFGLAAHAGRSEAKGLLSLTQTAPLPPAARRIAFIAAAVCWAMLMAFPGALIRFSPQPLIAMAEVSCAAAVIATVLAAVSHSSFAPRLVLLILWYGYLSG